MQQVSQVAEDEEITTPPDNVIAREMQAIEISNKTKASSSSSSSNIKASRVHIQEPKAKRLTPAAKMKQEVNQSLLSLLQKDQEWEDAVEDEIDLTFASMATRMRIHMNTDQREDLIQELEKLTTNAINNVWKGMPVLNAPPGVRQAPAAGFVLPMTTPPLPENVQNTMPQLPSQFGVPDPLPLQMQPQAAQHPVNEVHAQGTAEGNVQGSSFYAVISYNTPAQYGFPDMS